MMINKNNNQSVSGQLTIDYYNKNYYVFVESTQNVDFSDIQVFSGIWISC